MSKTKNTKSVEQREREAVEASKASAWALAQLDNIRKQATADKATNGGYEQALAKLGLLLYVKAPRKPREPKLSTVSSGTRAAGAGGE